MYYSSRAIDAINGTNCLINFLFVFVLTGRKKNEKDSVGFGSVSDTGIFDISISEGSMGEI